MGQICSGQSSEPHKPGAVGAADPSEEVLADDGADKLEHQQREHRAASASASASDNHDDPSPTPQTQPTAPRLREEQARLELIVSHAGRGMVPVRSTRGSNVYYDQGFAAALANHLELTTKFASELPVTLPEAPSQYSAYECLSQPQWDGIGIDLEGGDPHAYMDQIAESLLDSVLPAKQQLFAGVSPIVENLL